MSEGDFGGVSAIACRLEASDDFASAAQGFAHEGSLASALVSVKSACAMIEWQQQQSAGRTCCAGPLQLAAACTASMWPASQGLRAVCLHPGDAPSDSAALAEMLQTADIVALLSEHLPAHARVQLRPSAHENESGDQQRNSLEMEVSVDGAFTAVVALRRAAASVGASVRQGGKAVGGSQCLIPQRVAVGPSCDAMQHGASHAPTTSVFRDLCARAGALLVSMDALPVGQRLPTLLRWLSHLCSLFQSACCGCGSVFPTFNTSTVAFLPPTARGSCLLPYHQACFLQRHDHAEEWNTTCSTGAPQATTR